jgi:hypothetical protein
MAPLDWQASLEKLQAQLTPDKNKPGPWVVQLQAAAPCRSAAHQRQHGAEHRLSVQRRQAADHAPEVGPQTYQQRATGTRPAGMG